MDLQLAPQQVPQPVFDQQGARIFRCKGRRCQREFLTKGELDGHRKATANDVARLWKQDRSQSISQMYRDSACENRIPKRYQKFVV